MKYPYNGGATHGDFTMSEGTKITLLVRVHVRWDGDFDILKGLDLPFCYPGSFRARGVIDLSVSARGLIDCKPPTGDSIDSPTTKFEGFFEMLVLQSRIPEVQKYFGKQRVHIIIEPSYAGDPIHDEVAEHRVRIPLWRKLDVQVKDLHFGKQDVRIKNCLLNAGVTFLGDAVQKTMHDLEEIPNFGEKSRNRFGEFLHNNMLEPGMDTMGWKPPTDPSRTG